MKALGYTKAHSLSQFSIEEIIVPDPVLRSKDLLVKVRAISVNPIDYKIRTRRDGSADKPVILGWDVAGVVEKVGPDTYGFAPGDEIFYAGDLMRDGGNAELQAVDYRIVTKKPANITFAEAAAVPLTALTAWEAFFERQLVAHRDPCTVLIIGGAGGAGSMGIQILKAETAARVIATASRSETVAWCKKMGADMVIDHRQNLAEQLRQHDIHFADFIYSTSRSQDYLTQALDILRPFGHFCLIDDPGNIDINPFKRKAVSIHWEMMFAKTLNDYQVASQGKILTQIAAHLETGRIQSTCKTLLRGFSVANLQRAHELLESGKAVGKIVIDFATE